MMADSIGTGWKPADKYKGYTIQPERLKTNVLAIYSELKK